MVEQSIQMPDARVLWDLGADLWRVRRGDRTWQVRRWTWGERERLLLWAAPDGRLDPERFVDGLVGLLVEPSASESASSREEREWLASVTLELLGVRPDVSVLPLAEAAQLAASQLGWGPYELDPQPLPALDQLLAGLLQPAAPPEDGWNRIMVSDD